MTDPSAAFALGYLVATAQESQLARQWREQSARWRDLAEQTAAQNAKLAQSVSVQRENLLTQDLLIDDLRQRVAQLEAILHLVEGSERSTP